MIPSSSNPTRFRFEDIERGVCLGGCTGDVRMYVTKEDIRQERVRLNSACAAAKVSFERQFFFEGEFMYFKIDWIRPHIGITTSRCRPWKAAQSIFQSFRSFYSTYVQFRSAASSSLLAYEYTFRCHPFLISQQRISSPSHFGTFRKGRLDLRRNEKKASPTLILSFVSIRDCSNEATIRHRTYFSRNPLNDRPISSCERRNNSHQYSCKLDVIVHGNAITR